MSVLNFPSTTLEIQPQVFLHKTRNNHTNKTRSSYSVSCSQRTASEGIIKLPEDVNIPAVLAFGDSYVDSGNNNYISTVAKCNFRPYGKDFMGGKPTGRFTNGKTIADITAETLGVKEYLPAYLDALLQDDDLLTGVSFGSGGCGYDPLTAQLASVIPLSDQLAMFKEYIRRLKVNVGEKEANDIITNSLFLVVASTNDLGFNYPDVPIRRLQYDIKEYTDLLVMWATNFIQEIYKLGARKIAVFSAPPVGCLPAQRTLAGGLERKCVEKYNKGVQLYNNKLKEQLQFLNNTLPESKLAFGDYYNTVINIIENPDSYGMKVVDRGCCGTGLIEVSFLCNIFTPVCTDDAKYLFWDSFHPTEQGYRLILNQILPDVITTLFPDEVANS